MPTLVHYTVDGNVARLTLDSPDNRNALSTALVNQLHQGLTDATESLTRTLNMFRGVVSKTRAG